MVELSQNPLAMSIMRLCEGLLFRMINRMMSRQKVPLQLSLPFRPRGDKERTHNCNILDYVRPCSGSLFKVLDLGHITAVSVHH